MSDRETPDEINNQAAEWIARLDSQRDGHDAAAELEAWLMGDDRRRGAYFRAQAAWRMLDRAHVLGGRRPAPPARRPFISRRQALAGAASVAAVIATSAGYQFWEARSEYIETAIGEIRELRLRDGSLVAVNTASALAVGFRPEVRRIMLNRGEAWFHVAKNRARPFVVGAGNVRVEAVGTAFGVRRTQSGADVLVTEGTVEVWSVAAASSRTRVEAGSRTFVSDLRGAQDVVGAKFDIARSLAWRAGQLIFDGETLGQAAAEFNRYNVEQVRIDDPALAGERFVGRFHTGEPEAFARAAATLLNARAVIGRDEIRISR